jgi:hypothetical protein
MPFTFIYALKLRNLEKPRALDVPNAKQEFLPLDYVVWEQSETIVVHILIYDTAFCKCVTYVL